MSSNKRNPQRPRAVKEATCVKCNMTSPGLSAIKLGCPYCGGLKFKYSPVRPQEHPSVNTDYDPVTRPKGYNQGSIEVIDYIRDKKLDFCEGNVVKYVSRYKFKDGLQDLKKARWYLNRIIEEMEGDAVRD